MLPQDLLFAAIILMLAVWYLNRAFKREELPVFYRRIAWILFAYHLLFSLIFHRYILQHGGDSVGYWYLHADDSQGASTWMEHWGLGTFFVQWLNYLPSRLMGLSYGSGNLLYACISFLGFLKVIQLGYGAWGMQTDSPWKRTWVALLFLPNIHFWTAGVGKEALLWVGLVYALVFFQEFRRYHYGSLGLLLSFAVRPLNGAILLLLLGARLITTKTAQLSGKWVWVGLLVLLLLGAGYRLLYQTHMPGLTVSALDAFSRGQFAFLEGFHAGSEIPMATYSWPRRIWTIIFLPLDGGNGSIWHIAATVENGLSLLLLGIAGISWISAGLKVSLPRFLLYGMGAGIFLTLAYGLTLNNLGIIMRMKSFYILFFLLSAWHLLNFPKKSALLYAIRKP
jgi:hypothetical protein